MPACVNKPRLFQRGQILFNRPLFNVHQLHAEVPEGQLISVCEQAKEMSLPAGQVVGNTVGISNCR